MDRLPGIIGWVWRGDPPRDPEGLYLVSFLRWVAANVIAVVTRRKRPGDDHPL